MKNKLICMTFDGDYQTERPEFETIQDAWEHSEDLGSKWIFYPFHFVVTESLQTIKDAPELLQGLIGRRVKTIRNLFAELASLPEAQNLDIEEFAFLVRNSL